MQPTIFCADFPVSQINALTHEVKKGRKKSSKLNNCTVSKKDCELTFQPPHYSSRKLRIILGFVYIQESENSPPHHPQWAAVEWEAANTDV